MDIDLSNEKEIEARMDILQYMWREWKTFGLKYKEPYSTMIYVLIEQIKNLLYKSVGTVHVVDAGDENYEDIIKSIGFKKEVDEKYK